MNRIYFVIISIFIAATIGAEAFDVQPFKELNTSKDDYAVTFRSTRDGMEIWLTTYRSGSNTRSRRIVTVNFDKQGFGSPVEMPFPINQKQDRGSSDVYLDGSPCFSACDPNFGVFTSNRLYNGKSYGNDLYEMVKQGNEWKVRRIDEVNSEAWDDTPSLSPDGQYLYFASDRKRAGYGETDLYFCKRLAGGWSSPEPLDEICEINVKEQTPLAASDGYLYYATDKSGDFDIWRAKLDPVTGRPIAGSQEILPFEGVNKKGSSEGHPSFSPGTNYFIFSSDCASAVKAYDLYYKQLGNASDTINVRSLLRTLQYNKDFEEYEDITVPYITEITAVDMFTGKSYKGQSSEKGLIDLVIPRSIGNNPAEDRRIREIQVSARANNDKHITSPDTLLFELGKVNSFRHSLYIWDTNVLTVDECKQNFPITDVEFFISAYWCPTTKKFSKYTSCQSVFPDPECMQVPEISQPCSDNDLYRYRVVQPRVERTLQPGLCAGLSEVSKHGKEWSDKVDNAIVSFVDNVRSALKKPCIVRSLKQKKKITIEVIGWTDPRAIDKACLYTGRDIDFGTSSIKLNDYESKPYLRGGVLLKNTSFRESRDGGNQLLSEVRAFYTAELLDSLWKEQLPEYAELRASGMIEVVAVGKSIKQENMDMARQRSVNVRILADADGESFKIKSAPELGSSVALGGNLCLEAITGRKLEKTTRQDLTEKLFQNSSALADSMNASFVTEESTAPKIVKMQEEAPKSEPNRAVQPPAANPLSCYSIGYCNAKTESEARSIMDKLASKNVADLKLIVSTTSSGENIFRVISGCYVTADEAQSYLRLAKQTAKDLELKYVPYMIKK